MSSALQSCEKKISEPTQTKQSKDLGEDWLKNIFKCKSSKGFCYDVDKENKICTKRFMNFLIDSNEIYGASNLTDEEFPAAEKKYKEKWSKIYPLYSDEMWLFGRGNDDADNIKQVKINKISPLKYSVFIDFGDGIKSKNIVTLVRENNTFKIDYCETKIITE